MPHVRVSTTHGGPSTGGAQAMGCAYSAKPLATHREVDARSNALNVAAFEMRRRSSLAEGLPITHIT
jgi:hypothetical protein